MAGDVLAIGVAKFPDFRALTHFAYLVLLQSLALFGLLLLDFLFGFLLSFIDLLFELFHAVYLVQSLSFGLSLPSEQELLSMLFIPDSLNNLGLLDLLNFLLLAWPGLLKIDNLINNLLNMLFLRVVGVSR